MLPRETSLRQLKKLRAETKGTDIGDLTTNDRLNKNVPNMQAIGNPVDTGIESWDEFSKKDSSLQTIAFKSKLVNKPLVNQKLEENVNNVPIFNEQDYYILMRVLPDIEPCEFWDQDDIDNLNDKVEKMYWMPRFPKK